MHNVVKAASARKVHGVHVHLGEERSRGHDDGRDQDLASLSELAYVAGFYIPGHISAHEQPPVALRDKGIGCVEAVVSGVVMCHFQGLDTVVFVEYPLVGALGVMLPQYVVINEESASIVDDVNILAVIGVGRSLKVYQPVVCSLEPLI